MSRTAMRALKAAAVLAWLAAGLAPATETSRIAMSPGWDLLATGPLRMKGDAFLQEAAILRVNAVEDDPLMDVYPPITVDGVTVVPTRVMQALQPRIGRCYVGENQLVSAVRLWRQRRQDLAMQLLQEIKDNSSSTPATKELATRMMITVAQLHDMYQEIHENCQAVLDEKPGDIQATFIMALYHACTWQVRIDLGYGAISGQPGLELFNPDHVDEWLDKLEAASPFYFEVLTKIRSAMKDAWSGWDPLGNMNLTQVQQATWPGKMAIAVMGWGPIEENATTGEWQGQPPMMQRIDAGFELAQLYPEAKIIASGGAVYSGMTEGVYINQTLVQRDPALADRIVIDGHARDSPGNLLFVGGWIKDNAVDGTLLLVGSDWQNPRYKTIADGTLTAMDVPVTTQSVGAGYAFVNGGNLTARIQIEQVAIWRDAARSLGYFEACDFEPKAITTTMTTTSSLEGTNWMLYGGIAAALVVALVAVAAACYFCNSQPEQEDNGQSAQLAEA